MSISDINSKDYDFSTTKTYSLGNVDISDKSYKLIYKLNNEFTAIIQYEYAKYCPIDGHIIYLNKDDVIHFPNPNYEAVFVTVENSEQRMKYKTGKKKKNFKINPNGNKCICGCMLHKTNSSVSCPLHHLNIHKIFYEFNIKKDHHNYRKFFEEFNETNHTDFTTKPYHVSSPDYGDEIIEKTTFLLNLNEYSKVPTVVYLKHKLIESINSNEERINQVKEEMAEQHNICLYQQSYINRVKNAMFLDKHFPDKKMNCDICCEEKEFCKQYISECECNVTVCSKCSDQIRNTNEGQYKCPMCRNQEI